MAKRQRKSTVVAISIPTGATRVVADLEAGVFDPPLPSLNSTDERKHSTLRNPDDRNGVILAMGRRSPPLPPIPRLHNGNPRMYAQCIGSRSYNSRIPSDNNLTIAIAKESVNRGTTRGRVVASI